MPFKLAPTVWAKQVLVLTTNERNSTPQAARIAHPFHTKLAICFRYDTPKIVPTAIQMNSHQVCWRKTSAAADITLLTPCLQLNQENLPNKKQKTHKLA